MTDKLRIVDAVRDALDGELERDDSVIVYGEDVGLNGGVFRATEGLMERHPEQVFDSPLAEAGIVGLGIGLGAAGFTPVPEIQFVVPLTPANAKGLLTAAIRDTDPVVFMEPTRLYRGSREAVPEGEHVVPLGEARTVSEGEDVTLVAWGGMLNESLTAVDRVAASVEVIDPQTVWPLDEGTILESVRKTGRCVVVTEAPRTAGMAADITARLNDHVLYHLAAPVERVTGYDVPVPFFAREEAYLPGIDPIVSAIERPRTNGRVMVQTGTAEQRGSANAVGNYKEIDRLNRRIRVRCPGYRPTVQEYRSGRVTVRERFTPRADSGGEAIATTVKIMATGQIRAPDCARTAGRGAVWRNRVDDLLRIPAIPQR